MSLSIVIEYNPDLCFDFLASWTVSMEKVNFYVSNESECCIIISRGSVEYSSLDRVSFYKWLGRSSTLIVASPSMFCSPNARNLISIGMSSPDLITFTSRWTKDSAGKSLSMYTSQNLSLSRPIISLAQSFSTYAPTTSMFMFHGTSRNIPIYVSSSGL